ncbi:MAG: lipocalin family protein [Lautropia sp.]|nr:lipocalin family protein [Lautropia sp.]
MKKYGMHLYIAPVIMAVALPAMASEASLTTVAAVDVERYAGRWYEIARLPMPYQDQCASDTTATYHVNADGTLQVLNRCRQADGSWSQAEGLARSKNPDNSRLSVTFLPKALRWLPVGQADYWIMALDKDYQHALIGQPSRKYLWLLSRKPVMDETIHQAYLKQAREAGYDLSRMIRSPHHQASD